ncbi:serine/threonine protein kinase [Leptolyngbya cf. ectocarpi LEGE 11479]|uniref:non-specific serine/threonine protein kinase n=1 Tax=Leptolyngbya cf. ectocarpi LEGE 11479 TaxID=1828722 RepID=A0A928WZ62_LEPEC|nr:RIO1 family regulatory kinase/ATPase [Leptolyngbya ectocarpi]MBE9066084.1 serine/threonine protein kinase [Leptolyngbya cf. ectocarpi LEGE 11479]
MESVLSLEQFWQSLARQLLAYPSGDAETLTHRWVELQTLGIEAVYDYGPETLAGLKMLGLGYCGVVLRVRHGGSDRVLKIRREPAPQASLHREADMLMRANAVSVGPQYIAHSDNFLLMDYVKGPTLVDWLLQPQPAEAIHSVVSQLIYQAYRLDQAGMDHGDLRCITAHALVQSDTPVLIDFSGASLDRRSANVTTLVQGLFIGTKVTQLLRFWFPQLNKAELIEYLRKYKQQPSSANITLLLTYLELD